VPVDVGVGVGGMLGMGVMLGIGVGDMLGMGVMLGIGMGVMLGIIDGPGTGATGAL
jgi:hypothetical protein